MVSNVYSKSFIHTSASLAAQSASIINDRLLPTLEASASDSQAPHGLDVHSLFCATALDFITTYCLGIRNSCNFIQAKNYRDHWLKLYEVRKGNDFFPHELPTLSSSLSRIGLHLTPTWVEAANKEIEAWCGKMCRAATIFLEKTGATTQGSADDPVVLRALLAGIEREDIVAGESSPIYSTTIQQPELSVASEVIDHLLAGQETTGVTLTYVTWHLSQSEDLQRELREELLTLTPNMGLEGSKSSIPDSGQLDSLPILHALIVETVRRYAPAGGPEPRVVPPPSCHLGPYEIPGGVRVSASAYNLHRDEKVFPEPETWDHKRWLQDSDDEKRKEINRQFWGFSSGGRMCLGSNFAMHGKHNPYLILQVCTANKNDETEMKLVIAAIYSNYTSHIVDDEGIEPTDGYTGHPTSGRLWLRFQKIT
jgi:cytochrome P450